MSVFIVTAYQTVDMRADIAVVAEDAKHAEMEAESMIDDGDVGWYVDVCHSTCIEEVKELE